MQKRTVRVWDGVTDWGSRDPPGSSAEFPHFLLILLAIRAMCHVLQMSRPCQFGNRKDWLTSGWMGSEAGAHLSLYSSAAIWCFQSSPWDYQWPLSPKRLIIKNKLQCNFNQKLKVNQIINTNKVRISIAY